MRKIALLSLIAISLYSDVVEINDFQSDLFSKDRNHLKKVELSLLFDGRDLKENRYKIVDALNIIVSSFYVEDLFTSKGKENFKNVLSKYLTKKYSIDVDDIFIQKLKMVDNVSVDAIIDALKEEGFCKERKSTNSIKKNFEELKF